MLLRKAFQKSKAGHVQEAVKQERVANESFEHTLQSGPSSGRMKLAQCQGLQGHTEVTAKARAEDEAEHNNSEAMPDQGPALKPQTDNISCNANSAASRDKASHAASAGNDVLESRCPDRQLCTLLLLQHLHSLRLCREVWASPLSVVKGGKGRGELGSPVPR